MCLWENTVYISVSQKLNLMLQSKREPSWPYKELLLLPPRGTSANQRARLCIQSYWNPVRLRRLGAIPECETKINCHHFLNLKTILVLVLLVKIISVKHTNKMYFPNMIDLPNTGLF